MLFSKLLRKRPCLIISAEALSSKKQKAEGRKQKLRSVKGGTQRKASLSRRLVTSKSDEGGSQTKADMLTQFTQPTILKQIGPIRLAKFFEGFAEELKASNIVLPTMDYEKDNDFPGLAAALVPAERLPDRLRNALLTLEDAASPKNHDRLHETTKPPTPLHQPPGSLLLEFPTH